MFGRFLVGLILVSNLNVAACDVVQKDAKNKDAEDTSFVKPDEKRLEVRIQERWGALIKRDFVSAYQYLSPGYKKLFSVEKYTSGFGSAIGWESIEINSLSIDGIKAAVEVEVSYQVNIPFQQGGNMSEGIGLMSTPMQEVWLWSGGEWWYVVMGESRGV